MATIILGAVRQDPAPCVVFPFIKVLRDEEYSQILHLPPAFAGKVKYLVDREICLENSVGQRWAVKISKVDGSLAFHRGWNEFFTHQPLKVGQLLEFHYIKRFHFLVRVFGKSGCERINFSEGMKTAKTGDKAVAAGDEPIQKFDAVRNYELRKRDSRGKGAGEGEESPSVLGKQKESTQVMHKSGAGKSRVVPVIKAYQDLVDVPISYEENFKAFDKLEDRRPKEASGLQRGESSKASPRDDAAENAKTRRTGNRSRFQ